MFADGVHVRPTRSRRSKALAACERSRDCPLVGEEVARSWANAFALKSCSLLHLLLYRITEVVRATEGALSRGGRGAALLLRQPQVGSTVA